MIFTFTANPALDLTYSVPGFTLGASQRTQPPQVRAGGKGVNVARVLHEQGLPAQVLAPIGGDSGRRFEADLDAAGLAHRLTQVAAPTRSTFAFISETTTNVNETGTPLSPAEWESVTDTVIAAVTTSSSRPPVLVCSGSTPPQTPPDLLSSLVRRARTAGATTIVDTSGPPLLAAADAGADVLKPNDDEVLDALGGTDPLRAARQLAERSGGLVLLSMGPDGIAAVRATGPGWHACGARRLQGNTTGAGDAAVAAVAARLASEPEPLTRGLPTMLRAAVAWSGAAVLAPLAGSITDPTALFEGITITEF